MKLHFNDNQVLENGVDIVSPANSPLQRVSFSLKRIGEGQESSIDSGNDAPLHQLTVAIPILTVLLFAKQMIAPLAMDQQNREVDGIEVWNGRGEEAGNGPGDGHELIAHIIKVT